MSDDLKFRTIDKHTDSELEAELIYRLKNTERTGIIFFERNDGQYSCSSYGNKEDLADSLSMLGTTIIQKHGLSMLDVLQAHENVRGATMKSHDKNADRPTD